MTRRIFSLIALIASTVCLAQSTGLDNCGLTSEPLLTSSELAYFKNTFFTDNTHSKNFDFEGKEIAYFSCDGTVSEDGLLTKEQFFRIIKSGGSTGHQRPRSILVLDAEQQKMARIDAVILIDCKMYSDAELLNKLAARISTGNLLPGQ